MKTAKQKPVPIGRKLVRALTKDQKNEGIFGWRSRRKICRLNNHR
jgi:hypothetical protein